MQTLYDKLKNGNLPTKEVAKGCKNFDADFGETNGIPECGADALRIGLLAYTVQGRDINLDIKRVVGCTFYTRILIIRRYLEFSKISSFLNNFSSCGIDHVLPLNIYYRSKFLQ